MPKIRILIIDDEVNTLTSLSRAFSLEGFDAVVADSGSAALKRLEEHRIDLVLCDVVMPKDDGLATLRNIKKQYVHIPVIMMSGQATVSTAVEAIKLGAIDFIEKPVSLEKLHLTIDNVLHLERLKSENRELRMALEEQHAMVGQGPKFQQLWRNIELAARSNTRVLIMGENGTGKELVARAIHRLSNRHDKPFIHLNCAAVPADLIESELFGHEKGAFTGAIAQRQGKFEMADKGTLMLDEIGDMPLAMQAKLLRVLQEEEFERVGSAKTIRVDVRVVAATNQNLLGLIAKESFRRDLYFRLNVFPIHVPPLRERLEDIPSLFEHYVHSICRKNNWKTKPVEAEAIRLLQLHNWPGNIRELKNLAERVLILSSSPTITAEDVKPVLPTETQFSDRMVRKGYTLKVTLEGIEKELILKQLEINRYHITNTARDLGLERSHLYKKCKGLGIDLAQLVRGPVA
ncbi:MAG: sigma-54-dependent Fis family transcriptional regulator [Acidobacteria bacterium]|nr:sigma-54-dependent Fis family transcriptional regulator [Acidobacteriota bacterium]